MSPIAVDWRLGLLVGVLVAAAAGLSWFGEVGSWRDPMTAAVRAAAQLGVISLVLLAVLQSLPLTALFLAVMATAAAATAYRRITSVLAVRAAWLVLPILVGVLPVLGSAVLSGVVPSQPVAVLPIAGIIIGGTMSATSLAGRRVTERMTDDVGQFEAALAIGLTHPQAVRFVGRPAASLALVPGLDQTRTVGLVTLPGAFIGVLLGGGSPTEAGAAQLIVLTGLLYAQAAATVVTIELVAHNRLEDLHRSDR